MVLASDEEKLFRPHAYPTPQGLGGEQVQGPLRQWESAPTKGSGVPAHSEEGRAPQGGRLAPWEGVALEPGSERPFLAWRVVLKPHQGCLNSAPETNHHKREA